MTLKISISLLFFLIQFIFVNPVYSEIVDQTTIDSEPVEHTKEYPHPIISGLYSLLIPGGGYFYNGNNTKGALAAPLTIPLISYHYTTTETFNAKSIKTNTYRAARNIYFYTIFDSYQDAVDANPEYKPVLPIKHVTPFEAYTAPFNINNYSWASIGLAIPLYALFRDVQSNGIHAKVTGKRLSYAIPLIIAQSVLIGVGEEYFSRGFVFSASSQITGSQFAGNMIQSIDFGFSHTRTFATRGYNSVPYGLGTIAFFSSTIDKDREYATERSISQDATDSRYFISTFIFGFYMGLLTSMDYDGILDAIALHAVWDAVLITRDLLVTGKTGTMYFEISVPFHF